MQTRLLIPLFSFVFSLGLFAAAPLSQSMPSGAMGFVELKGLGNKLMELRDSKLLKSILASPQFKQITNQPEYVQAMAGKGFVEGFIGMDLWKAADVLLNEAAVGVYPNPNGEPAALLMLRVQDAKAWAKLRLRLNQTLDSLDANVKREKNGELDIINVENQVFITLHKNWAVAASTRQLMKRGVAGLNGQVKKTVADDPAFRKMQKNMGAEHLAQVYLNISEYAEMYNQPLEAPEKMDNGVVSLLLQGIIELAAGSPYLGLTLDVDKNGFSLVSGIEGDVAATRKKRVWFFSDPKTPGTRDVPAVPGLMGGITIHRNIGQWYGQREQLLDERLMAGFDEFEAGLGNLFPGRDIGDDIMPAFGSTFTLLAAEQTFEHFEGAPGIKLPGFALIFDLDKPENGGLFQLVFQTIVTITNIAGAEEGLDREPSVMTAIVHKGVPINTIQYLQQPKGKRLNIGYNFMPCAATINGRFVFCTSLKLCKALVEELAKPQNPKRVNRNFNFELHLGALAGLLKDNRNTVVAKRIQQGKTAAEANGEVTAAESVLDYVKLLRLSTSVKEKGFQLKFEGQWK